MYWIVCIMFLKISNNFLNLKTEKRDWRMAFSTAQVAILHTMVFHICLRQLGIHSDPLLWWQGAHMFTLVSHSSSQQSDVSTDTKQGPSDFHWKHKHIHGRSDDSCYYCWGAHFQLQQADVIFNHLTIFDQAMLWEPRGKNRPHLSNVSLLLTRNGMVC